MCCSKLSNIGAASVIPITNPSSSIACFPGSQPHTSLRNPIESTTQLYQPSENHNAAMFLRPARRCLVQRLTSPATRYLHASPFQLARKDAQGKDELKPEPNEYSKSGSDDAAARTEGAAFDPNTTSPEGQHEQAGSETKEGVSRKNLS